MEAHSRFTWKAVKVFTWYMLSALLIVGHAQAVAQDAHDWSAVLQLSYRFYEAQQSGALPLWNRAALRNGGWRSDSHIHDGFGPGGIGLDLSGGMYDKGDHLKQHLTMFYTGSILAAGVLGSRAGYEAAGQSVVAAQNLRRLADYIIKCHISASDSPAMNALVAQVGDMDTDHSLYWGRPEQQPEMGQPGSVGWRPVAVIKQGNPGANVVGQAVAALTSISLLLRMPGSYQDLAYADVLMTHARQLYGFALVPSVQGVYTPSGGIVYPDGTWTDDMAWAATWLCINDGGAYCTDATNWWELSFNQTGSTARVDWSSALPPTSLLMLSISGGRSAFTQMHLDHILNIWQDSSQHCPQGFASVCYTPAGLAWFSSWGSLRYSANVAGLALGYAQFLQGRAAPELVRRHRCWARSQLSYMLGSNPQNRSFVVGYRPTPFHSSPRSPHHRSSSCSPNYSVSCSWDQLNDVNDPNPSVLMGALVGGPDWSDNYEDSRQDYIQNEPALDYNAAFTGALAAMVQVSQVLPCSWDAYCSGGCDDPSPPTNNFNVRINGPTSPPQAPKPQPAATPRTTTPPSSAPPQLLSPPALLPPPTLLSSPVLLSPPEAGLSDSTSPPVAQHLLLSPPSIALSPLTTPPAPVANATSSTAPPPTSSPPVQQSLAFPPNDSTNASSLMQPPASLPPSPAQQMSPATSTPRAVAAPPTMSQPMAIIPPPPLSADTLQGGLSAANANEAPAPASSNALQSKALSSTMLLLLAAAGWLLSCSSMAC